MLIDLLRLEDGAVEFDFSIEPGEIDLDDRFSRLTKPAGFAGKVTKEGWVAMVSANSAVSIERKCDRCLLPVGLSQDVEIECGYVKYSSLDDEREVELDIRGLEYSVIESNELNLKEVFAEHLLLALPDGFLCESDCLGICPDCGARLKTAECGCGSKPVDPRWAALGELKEDLD